METEETETETETSADIPEEEQSTDVPVTEAASESTTEEQPTAETTSENTTEEQPTAETTSESTTEEQPTAEMTSENTTEEEPTAETTSESTTEESLTAETTAESKIEEQPTAEAAENTESEIFSAEISESAPQEEELFTDAADVEEVISEAEETDSAALQVETASVGTYSGESLFTDGDGLSETAAQTGSESENEILEVGAQEEMASEDGISEAEAQEESLFTDNISETDVFSAEAFNGSTVEIVGQTYESAWAGEEAIAADTADSAAAEIPAARTASFENLKTWKTYVFMVVKDSDADDLLAADNLLYIAQASTDGTGALSFTYVPRTSDAYGENLYTLADSCLQGHTWDAGTVTSEASCINTGKKLYTCTVCGNIRTEMITSGEHTKTEMITPATLNEDGCIEEKCSVCGETLSSARICYPKTIELSATEFTYNGEEQRPEVSVKDSTGKTVNASAYTVSYASGCKDVGTYSVQVTFQGNYSGTKTLEFQIRSNSNENTASELATAEITASDVTRTTSKKEQSFSLKANCISGAGLTYQSSSKSVKVSNSGKVTIAKNFVGKAEITITAVEANGYAGATKTITVTVVPQKISLTSVKNVSGRKLKVKWKKNTKISGYEIQYSTDKSFKKGVKTKTIAKKSATSVTLKSLKKGKTWYVRIRCYKKVSGTKYYSQWSKTKSVKVKK